ncbi:Transmembrane protein 165 [Nymphon striatum]|nr:Transmembrane protein 165 [Nymphon striatum]
MIVAGGLGLEVEITDPEIEISMLRSDHEEADTRVVLHCVHASSQHIVVSARDTDITIILLAHFDSMHCEKLWLKAGTSKKLKYIPIHEIRNTLSFEQPVLDALLAFHAITGCDTVSYLMGHSKKTSWDVFLEHNKLLQKIGEDSTVSEDGIRMAEAFICRIYKVPYDNCDKGRVHSFSKCKPPESLPPTTDADPIGVTVGGILGHACCTLLAVIGGRMIAQKISIRTVTLIGGFVFLAFAISAFFINNDS